MLMMLGYILKSQYGLMNINKKDLPKGKSFFVGYLNEVGEKLKPLHNHILGLKEYLNEVGRKR